jgi:hypothetical protein
LFNISPSTTILTTLAKYIPKETVHTQQHLKDAMSSANPHEVAQVAKLPIAPKVKNHPSANPIDYPSLYQSSLDDSDSFWDQVRPSHLPPFWIFICLHLARLSSTSIRDRPHISPESTCQGVSPARE